MNSVIEAIETYLDCQPAYRPKSLIGMRMVNYYKTSDDGKLSKVRDYKREQEEDRASLLMTAQVNAVMDAKMIDELIKSTL